MGALGAGLCVDALRFDPDAERLVPLGATRDKFDIPTRSPNALPGTIPAEAFDIEDARLALEKAREILGWVEARLQSPP